MRRRPDGRRPPRPRGRRPRACAGSLRPGAASVPLAVSTANGRAATIASPTLSGVRPPDRISGGVAPWRRRELPVEGLPGAAGTVRRVGVEQVVVGVEGAEGAHLRGVAHARGLDHAGAGAASRLAAVGRALVAVQLEQREPAAVGGLAATSSRVALTNTPATSTRRCSSAPISSAVRQRARARAAGPEDQAERPRAEVRARRGVGERGDSADLDPRHGPMVGPGTRLRAAVVVVPQPPCVRVGRALAELDRGGLLVVAAVVRDLDRVAGLVARRSPRPRRRARSPCARRPRRSGRRPASIPVDGGGAPAAQAGLVGGAALARPRWSRARRRSIGRLRSLAISPDHRGHHDAEVGALDLAAGAELGEQPLGGVDRDREADAHRAAAAARGDLGVDADHAAVRVQQRAARVARVDRTRRSGSRSRSRSRWAPRSRAARADTMPVVTVRVKPNGLPIATTGSPTLASLESPSGTGGAFPIFSGSTLSTARSVDGSRPFTSAGDLVAVLLEAHRHVVRALHDVGVGDDGAVAVHEEARAGGRALLLRQAEGRRVLLHAAWPRRRRRRGPPGGRCRRPSCRRPWRARSGCAIEVWSHHRLGVPHVDHVGGDQDGADRQDQQAADDAGEEV